MTTNPLIEMMRRIRLEIFERARRGSLNYAGDMATLKKHLHVAEEMNDLLLIAQTYNAMGTTEMNVGHFTQAEEYLLKGAQVATDIPHEAIGGVLQNNLGEAYRRMGDYQSAIAVYKIAERHGERVGSHKSVVIAQNNLGITWLAMGDYDQAAEHFKRVFELVKDAPWDHVSTMIESYAGLAEVALEKGDLAAAWSHAAKAEELAKGRDFKVMLAQVLITKAHIAEQDPQHHDDAQGYYHAARENLSESGLKIDMARVLLEEARYQQKHGNVSDVVRLAGEARDIFHELGLTSEVELADALINTPAAST